MAIFRQNWKQVALVLMVLSLLSSTLVSAAPAPQQAEPGAVVAQVFFRDQADLNDLAGYLDIWEVNHAGGYCVALLPYNQYQALVKAGYLVVIDQAKTEALYKPHVLLPGQVNGIPGYECYRTVEETFTSLTQMALNYPDLVEILDIGDSWDKTQPDGPAGYDLKVIKLTNETNAILEKPRFFLMAEAHAREYTTSETATRYAEYLLLNYGSDPDITWMLDYYEVYILPYSNPDGRKFAETGFSWRKNTNNTNGCTSLPGYGTDLNRNSSFKWGGVGTSTDPCYDTYRGPSAASEPETQAIQGLVSELFTDQRGPGDSDPAPATTTGLLISLHSYSPLVLFPWGWSTGQSPNNTQLETLGRKFGYYNDYPVCQSGENGCIYQTSGSIDDWAYGVLGIAAYTYEMGTSFFQGCSSFESTIWPDNLDALLYAFKAARLPYMTPAGPEITTTTQVISALTDLVTLNAAASDTRYYSGGWGNEPSQNINAARYSVDTPSWQPGVALTPMTAADGNFNSTNEGIRAVLDTTGWTEGRYSILMEAKDAANNWGVPTAVFVDVPGYVFEASVQPAEGYGVPGQAVEYLLTITNTGLASNSFTISAGSTLGWQVTAPATAGPINAGASLDVAVTVTIPAGYTSLDLNLLTLKITPQGANQRSQSVTATTGLLEMHLFLPIIGNE